MLAHVQFETSEAFRCATDIVRGIDSERLVGGVPDSYADAVFQGAKLLQLLRIL
jgi:hypothetical protein